jgi:hypothetical protein
MLLTANLSGGLGNQLFQIANAYAYAKRYGFELVFKDSWFYHADRDPIWSYYFIDINPSWKLLSSKEHASFKWHLIRELYFFYTPIKAPLEPLEITMLEGYYQSSQYFNDYANEIRSLLQIHPTYLQKARVALSQAGINEPDGWIAAHVRRGDYVNNLHHYVADVAYFKRARARIQADIGGRTVCWITDDIEWVYKNVYEQGDVVQSSDKMTDFASLAQFRHILMSNSTFSWWATWLNPLAYESNSRKICCPSTWFGPKGPPQYESIYEPDWIRVDVETDTISG